jgi:adenosine deaminase
LLLTTATFGVGSFIRPVGRARSLTREEIVAIARNGFEASLIPPADKEKALAEVARVTTATE